MAVGFTGTFLMAPAARETAMLFSVAVVICSSFSTIGVTMLAVSPDSSGSAHNLCD